MVCWFATGGTNIGFLGGGTNHYNVRATSVLQSSISFK